MNILKTLIQLVLESLDDRIKRGSTSDEWRGVNDDEFENNVDELRKQKEYRTMQAFVSFKLDNDEYSFSTEELQALARNFDKQRLKHDVSVASPSTTAKIKDELTKEYGFKFVARQPTKHFRGSMSSGHGSHPFAGAGGGGSGFGSGFDGPTFTAFGGGPGAMGSGKEWRADDEKNLSMGSKRKR